MIINDRIKLAIKKMKMKLELVTLDKEAMDKIDRDFDITFLEYVKFQEIKSLKFAEGVLSLDEANTIYDELGGSPNEFNKRPLGTKIALTKAFAELSEV